MNLSIEQMEYLAELHRARSTVIKAEALLHQSVDRCWSMGIPAKQIASAIGVSGTTIRRNKQAAGYRNWRAEK